MRHLVFNVLLPLEKGQKQRLHVEDRLNKGYEDGNYSEADRRFGTYLAYGILRHWFSLEALIARFSKVPVPKLDPAVRLLLRMGLFQLTGMDSVPDYAAVSSTLELATRLKLTTKSRGLINAVLNTAIREQAILSREQALFPPWWLNRLQKHFTPEQIHQVELAYLTIPRLSIRVNTLKTDLETYQNLLTAQGVPFEVSQDFPEVLWITTPQGDPRGLPGFNEGYFYVQDESSARVATFLAPVPGETVLEFGAAPGSKTSHLAAIMQNTGRIMAVDVSEKRLARLQENITRLGISIVESIASDALQIETPAPLVDKVLIDAPCSGTGTLSKHPEILLTLAEKDFKHYPPLQKSLLDKGFTCLKSGGVMVYSTCSVDYAENQELVGAFLQAHPDTATLVDDCLILPNSQRDGFYMAKILKR